MPQYETNKHMKMAFTGEPVGIGDGEEDEFPLSVAPILAGSQTIYIDDVPQEETTDYTINATTGVVTFGTARRAFTSGGRFRGANEPNA